MCYRLLTQMNVCIVCYNILQNLLVTVFEKKVLCWLYSTALVITLSLFVGSQLAYHFAGLESDLFMMGSCTVHLHS